MLSVYENHGLIVCKLPFKAAGLVLIGIAFSRPLVEGAMAIFKEIGAVIKETGKGRRFVDIDDAVVVAIIALCCHPPGGVANHLRFGDWFGQHGQRLSLAATCSDGYYNPDK